MSASVSIYEDLYNRWERQRWQVDELDFSADQEQWGEASPDVRRTMFFAGRFTGLYLGEAAVLNPVASFLPTFRRLDQKVYLGTQLADESLHNAFFEHVHREILDQETDEYGGIVIGAAAQMPPAFKRLFEDGLGAVTDALRRRGDEPRVQLEAITMLHLIVEGTIGMSMQHAAIRSLEHLDALPATVRGFRNIRLDEVRHVQFGVHLLRDLIAEKPERAQVIVNCANTWLPVALEMLKPDPGTQQTLTAAGLDPELRRKSCTRFLLHHLRAVGIPVKFLQAT